jgi:hypothetical protein
MGANRQKWAFLKISSDSVSKHKMTPDNHYPPWITLSDKGRLVGEDSRDVTVTDELFTRHVGVNVSVPEYFVVVIIVP